MILGWSRRTFVTSPLLISSLLCVSRDYNMIRVRTAGLADVENVLKVVMEAMPYDPQWNYRFPYRHLFPEDHYKYNRMLYEQFTDPANDDWRVVVAEATSPDNRQTEIVASSVWDVSYINKRRYGSLYQPQNVVLNVLKNGGSTRRDINPARQRVFVEGGAESRKYFAKYGNDQITLQILATHPEHWRRGYGTLLCQYGMKIAEEEDLVVTLVAGKTGGNLYKKLGFTYLGTLVRQVPGEEEQIVSEAMVYEPKAASNM